jgi:DNA-binding NtrC family response regulator
LARILVVDDQPSIRETLKILLIEHGYEIFIAEDGEGALELIKETPFDIVVSDLRMPKIDGVKLLEQIKDIDSTIEVIVISAYADIKNAVKAIKMGAFDYLQKSFSPDELIITVEKALERKRILEENRTLQAKLQRRFQFEDIVGESTEIKEVFTMIEKVSASKATILLTGESGTGKEIIARAIHKNSERASKLFVPINCAAIPENLIESELFGHEKGAFTGAIQRKMGKFEQGDGGTIFLDEIGELPPSIQVKLLRFLQEKEFERVGGLESIKVNVRLITATNKDLLKSIESGSFREDLYYRINVVNIVVPPLRDRKDDIPLLVQYYINQFNEEYQRNIKIISLDAMDCLMGYNWPGNVRELKNIIERAVAVSDYREETILPKHLPIYFTGKVMDKVQAKDTFTLEEWEKIHIYNVLQQVKWNKSRAAEELGINRQTLYNKIKEYSIEKTKGI